MPARQQQRRKTAAKATAPAPKRRPAPEPEEEEEDEEEEEEAPPPRRGRAAAAEPEEEEEEEADEDELPEVFDLSEVPDDPGYELLPAGIYPAEIDEVRYELSQSSSNPMLTWVLKVERPEGGSATLFYHTTMAGKGLSRTKRTLLRLDPELDISEFRPDDADEMFGGMDVRAKVRIQNYQGEKRNGVTELLSAEEFAEE